MARRSKKSSQKVSVHLVCAATLAAAAAAAALVLAKGSGSGSGTADSSKNFSIADYRQNASRLTGNSYSLQGRVENIEALGNDRLVAVSIPGNKMERLPLLVRSGVCGKVNLTRGDTFVFEVDCRTGHDTAGQEVKGILVVRKVETK